jgi:hypothetical protein
MPTWKNRIVGHREADPRELKANPLNYRTHPLAQAEGLRAVLDEVGLVQGVIVNRTTGRLIDGHLRVDAAIGNGETTIPVVEVELTEAEERLVLATFDPLGAMAGVDEELLGALLGEVATEDEAIAGILATLEGKIKRPTGSEDPGSQLDRADDLRDKWKTALGQLWELPSSTLGGKTHRLLCGDSTSSSDVQRLFAGERATLCATDPPYLVDYDGTNRPQSAERGAAGKSNNKRWDTYHGHEASVDFFAGFLRVAIEHALVENPAFYQWHASRRQALVEAAWKANDLLVHQQLIWTKSRPILTRSHFMWQHEPCFYGWINGRPPTLRPPSQRRLLLGLGDRPEGRAGWAAPDTEARRDLRPTHHLPHPPWRDLLRALQRIGEPARRGRAAGAALLRDRSRSRIRSRGSRAPRRYGAPAEHARLTS